MFLLCGFLCLFRVGAETAFSAHLLLAQSCARCFHNAYECGERRTGLCSSLWVYSPSPVHTSLMSTLVHTWETWPFKWVFMPIPSSRLGLLRYNFQGQQFRVSPVLKSCLLAWSLILRARLGRRTWYLPFQAAVGWGPAALHNRTI